MAQNFAIGFFMAARDFFVVGIGASAGGHEALQEFFQEIPEDSPAAFVVVTHLLRTHRSELARILSRFTDMDVVKIGAPLTLKPGVVYVMPEDVELVIRNGRLYTRVRVPAQKINRSIDIFFEALAHDQRRRAIGVVLSGMGTDGSSGALHVFEEGGEVLVQDPSTTRFSSMPLSTILKDHPEHIMPPRDLGRKVHELITTGER